MMNMAPNVLRNLFTKKATRNYPFEKRDPIPAFRGELYNDIDECIFCGTCGRKCPSQCIEVDKKTGLWQCDPFLCVYCGICADACPTKCLHFHDVHRSPAVEREMMVMHGEPPKPKKKAAKKSAE